MCRPKQRTDGVVRSYSTAQQALSSISSAALRLIWSDQSIKPVWRRIRVRDGLQEVIWPRDHIREALPNRASEVVAELQRVSFVGAGEECDIRDACHIVDIHPQ